MPKKGRGLEKLVAHLEQVLTKSEDVIIESPGYLPDKTNDEPREFDVLLTITRAHHTIHIAFEVKDWRMRKVGTPEIERLY